MMAHTTLNPSLSEATVESFLNALNHENFSGAAELLAEDVKFIGVLGKTDGKKAYIDQISKLKFKYEIIKMLHDDDYVSVLYNIDRSGKKIITAGWYEVKDGLIQTIRVIFDPRPVLQ